MNIPYYLEMYSRKFGKKIALKTEDSTYTYSQLNDSADKLALSLEKAGITKGDKVLLFIPNSFEFVVSYFSVLKIGAIVVPINTKLTATEIQMVYEDANASAIITDRDLVDSVTETTIKGVKITTGPAFADWISLPEMLTGEKEKEYVSTMAEGTISTILYTSGTTGMPKGVVFNNRNILSVAKMINIEMKLTEASTTLIMMPLSHSAPLHLFFVSTIIVGGTVVTRKEFHPLALLQTVQSEKTTHFFGAPVAYLFAAKLLVDYTFDLSSMEWWVYGGAPLGANEVQYIEKQLQTDRLTCVYGLTEAGPSGALLFPEEHKDKVGSIGKRASLFTELKIVNMDGEETATNEIGEILLKGLGIMAGYYNKPKETEDTFHDGWLKTGDLGKYDEDGYIWVVDRVKDMIITGGINVFPFEVEQKMLEYPDIEDVAVIGVPHPDWGETVKAYYVSKSTIDIDRLTEFLQHDLASHKVPKIYEKIDALPRNTTGKLLKHLLRQQATSTHAPQ